MLLLTKVKNSFPLPGWQLNFHLLVLNMLETIFAGIAKNGQKRGEYHNLFCKNSHKRHITRNAQQLTIFWQKIFYKVKNQLLRPEAVNCKCK